MLPESVFFVLHRPSGTGHSAAEAGRLQAEFHCRFGGIACRASALAASHDDVVRMTRDFLAWAPAPSLLIAGGGGGTFRAMVQGVMECADSGLTRTEHTWVSALRLGSGNVVPKHLGIASDPPE